MNHRGAHAHKDPTKSPLYIHPREPREQRISMEPRDLRWMCGVTTVFSRRYTLLPRTLASLEKAGFPRPRLFVDGMDGCEMCRSYQELGLELTSRSPILRTDRSTYGNWALALAELYARNPDADRYALFQDDVVVYQNLRQYLDACQYPSEGYWNLYTFPVNYRLIRKVNGWSRSNQRGLGALGLVFDQEAVIKLLSSPTFIRLPVMPIRSKVKHQADRFRKVDGAIVTAMKNAGIREYVHNPSLIQHTGIESSLLGRRTPHPIADSFRGEHFDALRLLRVQ